MGGKLEGKTVMVTGAGTGFGQMLAIKAAQEGAARVIVHYRSSVAGAEQTAAAVREAGSDATLMQGDISVWDEIKRMAARGRRRRRARQQRRRHGLVAERHGASSTRR